MDKLAQKLMSVGREQFAASVATAIFGTAGQLAQAIDVSRPPVRIGLWPCVSATDAETGMGLMAVLALLLEQWREFQVYRLFVRAEGEPEDFVWSTEKSQFEIEDWELEDLDDNVAAWATLEHADSKWKFTLDLEEEIFEDEEDGAPKHVLEAESVVGLVAQLPKLAVDLAEYFEAVTLKPTVGTFAIETKNADDSTVQKFLKEMFEWEMHLFLALWGVEWDDSDIAASKDGLMETAGELGNEFAIWTVARAFTRAMLPGFSVVGEELVNSVQDVIDQFPDSALPAIAFGEGLFRLGYVQESLDLLERSTENFDDDPLVWLTLAETLRGAGRFVDAADAFQRAIEADATSAALYTAYADLLLVMVYEKVELFDFILIDPEELESNLIVWEAVEAFEESLKQAPDDVAVLYRQLAQLIDLDEERFWKGFRRLVQLDDEGDRVRILLNSADTLEDLSVAISSLKEASTQNPERVDLLTNLAVVYIEDENGEAAYSVLEKAHELAEEPDEIADIERLQLEADDPEFESHLAEIADIINAGNSIAAEDMDFLEETLEDAPSFAEGYLLVARAYVQWDEDQTAVETLLDGCEHLPDDPDILEMLGRLLWNSDQQELALTYLNRGLEANPYYVPLLTTLSRCLFDNGQDDDARVYLARAELIDPRSPDLARAKAYIAKGLSEREDEDE